jgi:RNA polymerase sigma-70 factor (ECF subfamily)
MGDAWQEAFEEGRVAWPSVRLSFERFRERALQGGLDGEPPLQARDLVLAYACLDGDAGAMDVFDREIVKGAKASIARVHAEPDFVDEVCQELRRRMLVGPPAGLGRYVGLSPLAGWVRVSAVRLAYDLGRSGVFKHRRSSDADLESVVDSVIEPELLVLKRTLGPSFQEAFRAAIDDLTARERNVLRMHLVQDLSIDQIAAPYGVHRATAARWLADVRRKVFEGVRDRMAAEHANIDPSEFGSLARLVLSQLHISLDRLDVPVA